MGVVRHYAKSDHLADGDQIPDPGQDLEQPTDASILDRAGVLHVYMQDHGLEENRAEHHQPRIQPDGSLRRRAVLNPCVDTEQTTRKDQKHQKDEDEKKALEQAWSAMPEDQSEKEQIDERTRGKRDQPDEK